MSAGERRSLEDGIRRIDEGKDPAFTAFRNINVTVDDDHFRPFCSSNTFPYAVAADDHRLRCVWGWAIDRGCDGCMAGSRDFTPVFRPR